MLTGTNSFSNATGLSQSRTTVIVSTCMIVQVRTTTFPIWSREQNDGSRREVEQTDSRAANVRRLRIFDVLADCRQQRLGGYGLPRLDKGACSFFRLMHSIISVYT